MNSIMQPARNGTEPRLRVQTTLLELVRALSEITGDENEIVATVLHMVREKRVQLNGNFRARDLSARG